MNDLHDCEFVVDGEVESREYPIAQLTGWETVIFELLEESVAAVAKC